MSDLAAVPKTETEWRVAEAILQSDKEDFEMRARIRPPHNMWTVTPGMKGDAVRRARVAIAVVTSHDASHGGPNGAS